jgi:tetratricopeptide (TPR) repeat protein
VNGSIAQVGTQYLLTMKAVKCGNGESLASTEAQASDKNHVLEALGKMASEIRSKLGESLASLQSYDAPLESVTTKSLEALKSYSLGSEEALIKEDWVAAIALFERAICLDPNFAMAYAGMGTCYANLGESARAAEVARKAYELRERVSEREKLYIASRYAVEVTGNLEAARKNYELWSRTYPRDDSARIGLELVYGRLGSPEKALASALEALQLNPASALNYANTVGEYLSLNRLDEANTIAQQAKVRGFYTPQLHCLLYLAAFLQHDAVGMEREVASMMGKPGWEDAVFSLASDTAAYGGQFRKARELTRRAAESARHADEKEEAASYEAEAAMREALVGNVARAKQQVQVALAHSNTRDVQSISALAFALAGDSAQAKHLAQDLSQRFPEDTALQFQYLPTIYAVIALQRHGASKAIEALVCLG